MSSPCPALIELPAPRGAARGPRRQLHLVLVAAVLTTDADQLVDELEVHHARAPLGSALRHALSLLLGSARAAADSERAS
jgi:hypothetical protein